MCCSVSAVLHLTLTRFAIVLAFPVKPPDALHQLPLLTAAGEAHKVPREDLLQLPDGQLLHVIKGGQI